MELPDLAGQFIVDCQGRLGRSGGDLGSHDPADPKTAKEVLTQYVMGQRSVERPEAPLYGIDKFERVDVKSFPAEFGPDEVRRNQRWIGYRPDGSIFAVVLLHLDRKGATEGWALDRDQACLQMYPHEMPGNETASASPTILDRATALREPLGRDCKGRHGTSTIADYGYDPQNPQPTDVAVALQKSVDEEARHERPDAKYYRVSYFERHDAPSYQGSYPDDPARHARFVGFRPDGTVFADVVFARLVEDNNGWAAYTWNGCSEYGPNGRESDSDVFHP